MLAFNLEFDVVESTASHGKVKYLDGLTVTLTVVLHLLNSVIILTADLSGSPHFGVM